MTDVTVLPCDSYDFGKIQSTLTRLLAPFGGLDWVTPGMTVAIKANLVSAMKPETAAATHPTVICALTDLLVKKGAKVILGDSPGGLYNAPFVNRIYAVTGMKEAEKYGAILNQNFETANASFPGAYVAKNFTYTAYLDEADAIIDCCKLKTHGMMGMSCAAKNMFGVIPGTFKPEYHFRFPEHQEFAKMILDLDRYFEPKIKLCIADAIVGMEGNGPTQGTPRHIGALAASVSPHKLDLLCADLIGLGICDVPTLEVAHANGLIPENVKDLEVFGGYESLKIADYQNIHVHKSLKFEGHGKFASMFVQSALRAVPKVQKKECIGCKKCFDICPAKAISMKNGKPQIDRSKCITCFCCQEFCPKGAMKVHRPLVAKIINRTK